MLDLLTVTFRDLQGVAIAIAVANAIVLIAALVCVFVLHRLDDDRGLV